MANRVCDFCLTEGKGLFNRPEKLPDGHFMCKNCRQKIQKYHLPLKYDLFQLLVTAQPHMKDMIMDAYLENNSPSDCIAKFYPLPTVMLHEGEHCVNAVKASLTVNTHEIPEAFAPRSIMEIRKKNISNIPDANAKDTTTIEGMLYETEAAIYFMSEHIVNCHRLGYLDRKSKDENHLYVKTPTKSFSYTIEFADLFLLRERFFQKVSAALHHKKEHLIYIQNDNEVRITPGVYDISRSLRPGIYQVKAINNDGNNTGLHVRDVLGRTKDYYDEEASIDLSQGGTLEVTGEYELKWIGEKKHNS